MKKSFIEGKKRYYINVLYNYLGKGSLIIVDLFLIKNYLMYLGIESYGLISIYSILIILLSGFDFGLLPTTTRELSGYKAGKYSKKSVIKFLSAIEWKFIIIGLILPVIMFFLSGPINSKWLNYYLVDENKFSIIFFAMGFALYGRLIESIYRAALNGLQENGKINGINIICSIIKYIAIVLGLKYLDNKIQFIFFFQFFLSLFTAYIFRYLTYKTIDIKNNNSQAPNIDLKIAYKFSIGMAIVAIESILLGQMDRIILSGTLGLEKFGYYSLVISASSIIFLAIHPIVATFGPKAMELRAKKQYRKLINYYHNTSKSVTIVMGGVGLVLFLYVEEILDIWLSRKDIVNIISSYIRLMLIGNFINGLCWLPFQLQTAYGWVRYGIISNAIAILIITPALLYITPRYGIYGAITIWIILNTFYITFGISILHKKILKKEKYVWYLEDIIKPLIIQMTFTIIVYKIVNINSMSSYEKIIYFICIFLSNISIASYLLREKVKND